MKLSWKITVDSRKVKGFKNVEEVIAAYPYLKSERAYLKKVFNYVQLCNDAQERKLPLLKEFRTDDYGGY